MRIARAGLPLAAAGATLLTGLAPAAAPAGPATTIYTLDRTLPPPIVESSGLAYSTRGTALLWTIQGDGRSHSVFAVDARGSLRSTVRLSGATNVDWEDMASGPAHTLWVSDTGDNRQTRASIAVYRFKEPTATALRARMSVTPAAYLFRLPRGPRSVEALLVHPISGRLLFVSKGSAARPGIIFQAPAKLSTVRDNRLAVVGRAPSGVTSGEWAPNGRSFVLGTRTNVHVYARVGAKANVVALPSMRRSSSVTISTDSTTMYVGSRGAASPVHRAPLPPPIAAPPRLVSATLTNECGIDARGVQPSPCGILVGGTYGSNSDVAPWENQLGRQLGIQRRYYTGGQVSSAVSFSANALEHLRLPWVSFKLPYTWPAMATGRGDAWTRDLVKRLDALNGPVWLAFHHEPEGDGDILAWKRMQERLGPILRNNSDNVAYTVVLTGWHQLYGKARYRLDNMMPNTTVDVLGFDLYEKYGTLDSSGITITSWTSWGKGYFEPLSRWAAAHYIAWGLAEVAFDDEAYAANPDWISQNIGLAQEYGAQAWAYFNTTVNNKVGSNWALGTAGEQASFQAGFSGTPSLR